MIRGLSINKQSGGQRIDKKNVKGQTKKSGFGTIAQRSVSVKISLALDGKHEQFTLWFGVMTPCHGLCKYFFKAGYGIRFEKGGLKLAKIFSEKYGLPRLLELEKYEMDDDMLYSTAFSWSVFFETLSDNKEIANAMFENLDHAKEHIFQKMIDSKVCEGRIFHLDDKVILDTIAFTSEHATIENNDEIIHTKSQVAVASDTKIKKVRGHTFFDFSKNLVQNLVP